MTGLGYGKPVRQLSVSLQLFLENISGEFKSRRDRPRNWKISESVLFVSPAVEEEKFARNQNQTKCPRLFIHFVRLYIILIWAGTERYLAIRGLKKKGRIDLATKYRHLP